MTVTSMNIYNQEFKKRLFNGYGLDGVDSFLEMEHEPSLREGKF